MRVRVLIYKIMLDLGNPSGGNKLRGLYNITLKSLGASVKRDPEVRFHNASVLYIYAILVYSYVCIVLL